MKQHRDAQNAFTTEAVNQHLALWQATQSLVQIESQIAASRAQSQHLEAQAQRGLWARVKNLFTKFGAS